MVYVPIVPPMKASQIEQRAMIVLQDYCPEVIDLEVPTPVDKIFELYIPYKTNIRTMYTSLSEYGITNAEGYTNARQQISIVDSYLADDFSEHGRRRFRSTSGHESGHCFLHTPLRQWQQSLQIAGVGMKRDRNDLRPFEDPEWQAWRFCHALCMPEIAVRQMANRYGIDEKGVQAMVDRFDMNPSFVVARLRTLKLIPARNYKF